MAATIKKIAELAGVSTGTVDRVINNRGRVNPSIEARIRNIILEVGYTPNLMAKSLSLKRRCSKIGIIFHTKSSAFTDEVLKGIARAKIEIADFGVDVVIRSSRNFDVDDQLQIIEELLALGVNAIAITPINDERIIVRIDQLVGENFPIFCFINDIETKLPHPFIGINAYQTGKTAAGLFRLLAVGASEKLAVITPSLKMLGHTQRMKGLRDTLSRIAPNIELLEPCEIPSSNDVEIYKVVNQYLAAHPTPTALWYATSISDGGITALREHDLLYKIRIVSLDIQSFISTGLEKGYIDATISQNPFQQGYLTTKIIFNSLLQEQYSIDLSDEVPGEILISENYDASIRRHRNIF